MKPLRLLHVEDSEDDVLLIRRHLQKAGYAVSLQRVETREGMLAALEAQDWDLVLSDHAMPRFSSLEALALIKQRGLDVPFIILSGAIGEETAVSAMRAGAHDYLMKDDLARLVPAIERELQEAAHRRERRRAEEALRTTERLATFGRLAATIAHEINNPLEAVTNLLYLLKHCQLEPAAQQYVELAEHELSRVAHLVKQALGFSRGSTALGPVKISELIRTILYLYQPRIQQLNVKICTNFECEGDLKAFPGEIRQVFSNLLVNAVDAVGPGGTVKVHVFSSHHWRTGCAGVRVVLADNGPGIAPALRKRIFEPFFTTKGEKGTGLGLWIANGILQKHEGGIQLRSSIEAGRRGTTFSVFIPVEVATEPRARAAAG